MPECRRGGPLCGVHTALIPQESVFLLTRPAFLCLQPLVLTPPAGVTPWVMLGWTHGSLRVLPEEGPRGVSCLEMMGALSRARRSPLWKLWDPGDWLTGTERSLVSFPEAERELREPSPLFYCPHGRISYIVIYTGLTVLKKFLFRYYTTKLIIFKCTFWRFSVYLQSYATIAPS